MPPVPAGDGASHRRLAGHVEHYGRGPCALRRARMPEVSAGMRGDISLRLRYQPPYDWAGMREALRRHAVPGVEQVDEDGYARSIELGGQHGVVCVRPAEDNALEARVRFPRLSALPAIVARLRRVFDLGADPLTISAHLVGDPLLAPLVAARPGLRMPGAWDGFELAMWTLLTEGLTGSAAAHRVGCVVEEHGAPLAEPARGVSHLFPRAEALARANLAALGLPRSRAVTLSALAAACVTDPDLFNRASDEVACRLRLIRGVEAATADEIAGRVRCEPDAHAASGFGFGMRIAQLAAIPADVFAGPHLGAILGAVQAGGGLGGAIGPFLGGWLFDVTGSYRLAFAAACVAVVGSAVAAWVAARPPARERMSPTRREDAPWHAR